MIIMFETGADTGTREEMAKKKKRKQWPDDLDDLGDLDDLDPVSDQVTTLQSYVAYDCRNNSQGVKVYILVPWIVNGEDIVWHPILTLTYRPPY